jgi:hypothetical protein
MESALPKLNVLFDELQAALKTLLGNEDPEFDWSLWNQTVNELRKDFHTQLERCRTKFNGDVESVGEYATRDEISGALQQLKDQLGH